LLLANIKYREIFHKDSIVFAAQIVAFALHIFWNEHHPNVVELYPVFLPSIPMLGARNRPQTPVKVKVNIQLHVW
jgi:hypothetical protein